MTFFGCVGRLTSAHLRSVIKSGENGRFLTHRRSLMTPGEDGDGIERRREVSKWRYCGRFNDWIQDAVPEPEWTWINEDEARRRYADRTSGDFTIVPPVDEATGIVPFYIVVGSDTPPSFSIIQQRTPGVKSAQLTLRNVGEKLFAERADYFLYPEVAKVPSRRFFKPTTRYEYLNREDGTGKVLIAENVNQPGVKPTVTTGDRKDIHPEDLYVPIPDFGEWDVLPLDYTVGPK